MAVYSAFVERAYAESSLCSFNVVLILIKDSDPIALFKNRVIDSAAIMFETSVIDQADMTL